jgi:primosomal protein N' (replication factor Y)
MYVIEVIPLSSLPPNAPQLLSYFYDTEIPRGSVVEVSLNHRKIEAVVVSCSTLESRKADLKSTYFQLKKLTYSEPKPQLVSDIQLKTALWLSKTYRASLGLCLKTVLPSFYFNKKCIGNGRTESAQNFSPPSFLISRPRDFLPSLSGRIRKALLGNGQVCILVPDVSIAEYLYKELSHYPEIRKYFSSQTKKEQLECWNGVASGNVQIIIGTRQSLFLPFKNLRLLIVEDPFHDMYKSDSAPRYNSPDLAKRIAELHGAELILTGSYTGLELYAEIKAGMLKKEDRLPSKGYKTSVMDMAVEMRENNFSIFSRELKKEFLSAIAAGQKVLLFSPRRGHSGILVCGNCGISIKCVNCSSPMKLHKGMEFHLTCHRCSFKTAVPKHCPNCSSVQLKPAGPSGTQKIFDNVNRFLYANNIKATVLILDSDVIKNDTEEEEILSTIKQKPCVVIATQMIFGRRFELEFPLIAVLNADAMSNVPDFRTEEKTLYQFSKMEDMRPAHMIIQTYDPQNKIFDYAVNGRIEDFYNTEWETRKAFDYPPARRLVKLTYKSKDPERASYSARSLAAKLKMAIVQGQIKEKIGILGPSPAFIEKERGLFAYNIVLKLMPEGDSLKEILKFVPSNWIIDADPKTIL